MRAARTISSIPFTSPPAAPTSGDVLDLLRETVAHLAERVELLETREHVSRAAFQTAQSRHRSES